MTSKMYWYLSKTAFRDTMDVYIVATLDVFHLKNFLISFETCGMRGGGRGRGWGGRGRGRGGERAHINCQYVFTHFQ